MAQELSEASPLPPDPAVWPRWVLGGKACVICLSGMDGLIEVGWVHTPSPEPGTAPLGWKVKACPRHVAAGEALCAQCETGAAA